MEFAKARHLTLATTVQLYGILVKVSTGQMKPQEFFDLLLETDGPVHL